MKYDNLAHLGTLIQSEINNGFISGAAIKVIHNNEEILHNCFGKANLENGTPIQKDTIFRMYSMTKPITAVAIMILYERGQINLLSPVSDYLEGFQNQKVMTKDGLADTVRPVTIQDLLNMTSGIVYPDSSEVGLLMGVLYEEAGAAHQQGSPWSTIQFCNRMGQIPLMYQPGERWNYGASADVLGAVIEVVTGRSYSQFLQEEIFAPLNMADTAFYVPEEKRERLAQMYDYVAGNKELVSFTADFLALFDYMSPPAFESGGAGLVSTIGDYSNFVLMLANGGSYNGTRILGRKTVEYIATPQLTKEQRLTYNWDSQRGYSYGNLCRSLVDPAKASSNGTVGEFGWDGWCGNYFFVDLKENLIMIYMVQRCGGSGMDYMRRLRSILYGAL